MRDTRTAPSIAPAASTNTVNTMKPPDTLALARLFQLASPALPVGGYSYSQGLESAIDAGIVRDEDSAQGWIADVLELSIVPLEAPLLLRLCAAWHAGDVTEARKLNDWLL